MRIGTTRVDALSRAARFRFPVLAEVREEVVAGRRGFGLRLVAGRAVVADAAGADEHRRRRPDRRRWPPPGFAWEGCGCRGAPPCAAASTACRRSRLPARLMTASAPSSAAAQGPLCPSGFQPTRVMPGTPVPDSWRDSPGGSAAGQHADVVPFLGIHLRQRAAEEPRAAGDHDPHRPPDAALPTEARKPHPRSGAASVAGPRRGPGPRV